MEEKPIITLITSIIIPTWNSGAHLLTCLNSLAQQTIQNFEVLIVDNGSEEFDGEKIISAWPSLNIKIIVLKENKGFAVACNLGAQKAAGRWLAFLNADAFPAPDWLEQFHTAVQRYPEAGAFSSFLNQANNPDLIDDIGDVYNFSGAAWKKGHGYPLSQAPLQPGRVFSANAAAAFYRRDIFFEIGGFDEDFFSYFEDVDLGFRLNLYGYQCLFLPGAKAAHVGSSSTGKDSDFALYHYHRNMEWTYLKNMPPFLFWVYLPVHFVFDLVFLINYLRFGKFKLVLRAKLDAIKGVKKMIAKRKRNQTERKASTQEINQLINRNLLTPFLQGKNLRRYNRENATKSQ
jgi:GT2 family glycosyltransferase